MLKNTKFLLHYQLSNLQSYKKSFNEQEIICYNINFVLIFGKWMGYSQCITDLSGFICY